MRRSTCSSPRASASRSSRRTRWSASPRAGSRAGIAPAAAGSGLARNGAARSVRARRQAHAPRARVSRAADVHVVRLVLRRHRRDRVGDRAALGRAGDRAVGSGCHASRGGPARARRAGAEQRSYRGDGARALSAAGEAVNPVGFVFGVHLHQPVGNFDHVFADHLRDVYRPLVERLAERRFFPFTLRISGPLLEWLEAHDAGYLDLIGRLATDGHVELLLAGFYEPVLASLVPADRVEQVAWMREAIQRRFGVQATGLWLTERVWEPA